MAIIHRKNLTVYNNIQSWKTFFDSFNSALISTSISGSALNVVLNNDITVTFSFSGTWFYIQVYRNSTQLFSKPMESDGSGKMEITVVASDDFFCMQVKDRYPHYCAVVYENISSTSLYGYQYDGSTRIPITAITLYDASNGTDTCTHGVVLNYACQTGILNFISSDILWSDTAKFATDNNLIACTTVAMDCVITFNGANYYSLGTNTLIPMDAS